MRDGPRNPFVLKTRDPLDFDAPRLVMELLETAECRRLAAE